jgi:mRNA-degrading endonuclease RelE of RelBE toxin-antitoxin system
MVDRMSKNLAKFPRDDRTSLLALMKRIEKNDLEGLQIKKLSGHENAYRVKKGDFRIIFSKRTSQENVLIAVERRSESTYKE